MKTWTKSEYITWLKYNLKCIYNVWMKYPVLNVYIGNLQSIYFQFWEFFKMFILEYVYLDARQELVTQFQAISGYAQFMNLNLTNIYIVRMMHVSSRYPHFTCNTGIGALWYIYSYVQSQIRLYIHISNWQIIITAIVQSRMLAISRYPLAILQSVMLISF